jgi:hypothetical protein
MVRRRSTVRVRQRALRRFLLAMLANRQFEWRDLDAQAVEVTTRVGSARVTVRLEFDAAGDIVGTWCEASLARAPAS